MFTTLLVTAAAAFSSFAAAQNYSTSGNLTVVPSSVPENLRNIWCGAQMSTCPEICGGRAFPNNCDPDTLTYSCVCTDGSHPNISNYANTLPSFVCAQWRIDCTAAHPNDYTGQQACQSVVCGSKNASANVASPSSSSAGASSMSKTASSTPAMTTTTKGGAASSSSAAPAQTTTGGSAAGVVAVRGSYGIGVLSAVLLGLFGFAL